MKPRAEKPNPHELAARERKSARLVLLIEDLAEGTPHSPLEVFARLTPEQWIQMSVVIGQRKPSVPSAATQLVILGYLRERMEGAAA